MNTTIVIVCFETQPIVRKAYESIREIYPDIPVIIVDGSKERNDCYTYTNQIRSETTRVFHVKRNIGHGEGMAFGIKHVMTKYILLMDSDVQIQRECIQPMEDVFNISKSAVGVDLYGVGQVVKVDNAGRNSESGLPYLHPHFALISKEVYLQFPPAAHHGAPMILPMRELHVQGRADLLRDFPVSEYVLHKGRGTVSTVRRTAYTRGWVK